MAHSGFYFDWSNWWTMVRLIRSEPDRAQRRARYVTMLVVVPLVALVHAIFWALDPIVFPSLRRTEVTAPVFLVGHARSGTTYLHRQMAADPQFSYVLLWEMFFPSLIEKRLLRGLLTLDTRLNGGRFTKKLLKAEEQRVGDARGMHDTGLFVPEEDDFMMTTSLASGFWIVLFPYMRDLDFYHVDEWPERRRRKLMDFYRECVRRQVHLNGGGTHLSKNPTFCGRIESLIETFPDARFVVQVRHPYKTIPSLLKLMEVTWKGSHRDPQRVKESLQVLAEQSFHSYEYPLQVLERRTDVRSCIVEYRDLVGRPEETLATVYGALELTPPKALGDRDSFGRGEHVPNHSYSLEEFGLEANAIHDRLAPLFDRFGWDPVPKENTNAV